jgi:acyl-CoA synthetase (AMP-forming)/AMP-acid ligase II
MAFSDTSAFDERSQLLPHIVDHYARVKPDAIYAEYPVLPRTYEDGYRPITFKAFANAINGIAHWLVDQLGHGNGEILAYLGPNDLRYPALVLGAIKAGYCVSGLRCLPRRTVELTKILDVSYLAAEQRCCAYEPP